MTLSSPLNPGHMVPNAMEIFIAKRWSDPFRQDSIRIKTLPLLEKLLMMYTLMAHSKKLKMGIK